MTLTLGLLLFAAVLVLVLIACTRSEDTLIPEEPWLEWDGEVPVEYQLGAGEIQEVRS